MTKAYSENLGVILAKLDDINARVSQVHEAVYGNGDRSKALVVSVDRMEIKMDTFSESCKTSTTEIGKLATAMTSLTTSVDAHHKTTHLWGLLQKPKFWGYGLLAFLGVNLAVDLGRPWIVALIKAWTGVTLP